MFHSAIIAVSEFMQSQTENSIGTRQANWIKPHLCSKTILVSREKEKTI